MSSADQIYERRFSRGGRKQMNHTAHNDKQVEQQTITHIKTHNNSQHQLAIRPIPLLTLGAYYSKHCAGEGVYTCIINDI